MADHELNCAGAIRDRAQQIGQALGEIIVGLHQDVIREAEVAQALRIQLREQQRFTLEVMHGIYDGGVLPPMSGCPQSASAVSIVNACHAHFNPDAS
jgi:hypothetical protein